MTKIIIIFLTLISAVNLYSQQINKYGLKVVKQAEIYEAGELIKTYKFEYNDKLELIFMGIYTTGGEKITYHLTEKNGLKRTSTHWTDSETTIKYGFDLNGCVSQVEVMHQSSYKNMYDFIYRYNNDLKRYQMVNFRWSEWYKPKGRTTWYKQRISKDYTFMYDEEGYLLCFSDYPIDDKRIKMMKDDALKRVDSSRVNDTNIALDQLIQGERNLGDYYVEDLCLVEWAPLRSEYLMSDKLIYKYEIVKDNDDNIIEINRYFRDTKPTKSVRIQYL